MLLLVLIVTFVFIASGNNFEVLLFDTSFQEYITISRASNIVFQESLDFFADDVEFNYKNDSIVSILEELTEYNKTAHLIHDKLGAFITNCPNLVQAGSLCVTSIQDSVVSLDLAIEMYSIVSEEIEDDAFEKIFELKQDFEQIVKNCDERNSSSVMLSLKITDYWYIVEESLDKVEKMHVILKQKEQEEFLSTGVLNMTAGVSSQSLLVDIRNVSNHVSVLGRAIHFCQKNILKYSLINNTEYL